MSIGHSITDMKLIWTLWILLVLVGVCLPVGVIVALLYEGIHSAFTIGNSLVMLSLSYMTYDCGRSVFRQLPWKVKS